MKPSFHIRPLNTPFEDPGLYVRILREGRALMFDLGFTTGLSLRDILKTSDIFISHTHVDHFIGFDSIMRVCLKRERPLNIFGPEGIADCVEGKLRGYTWNIIEKYPAVINVTEVMEGIQKKYRFSASNSFIREKLAPVPFNGTLIRDTLLTVSAAILDHQIPCLAFGLKEDNHINIDKSKLRQRNLPVGPWLGELKKAIREDTPGRSIQIHDRTYSFAELRDIATITRGQKVSYVVDAVGSDENRKKIIELVRGSDVLYIEAYFLDRDRERAKDRYHLTAKEAGSIAREAAVGRVEALHFSPRYLDDPGCIVREVQESFAGESFLI